jgi:uncharacterized protein YdhG (YjbR/CyaY superfamily)
MHEKPETIDAYLATIDADRRRPLENLRRTIRRAVPAAQECVSYGIPAFRVDGGILAGFAATKNGFSYYPFSGQTLSVLAREVAGFKGTKSALHVSAGQVLSVALLRKLLATRWSEIRRKRATVKARGPSAPSARGKPDR